MSLSFVTFQLGPMENNTYLLADDISGEAVIIDPSFEGQEVVKEAQKQGWRVKEIWLTHAHFDHIAGINAVIRAVPTTPEIGLHPDDLELYRMEGGAHLFQIQLAECPEPSILFSHGQHLKIGDEVLEVRHTPGHTPGHVVFYSRASQVVFCGDLIFYRGVGRTDLPGGNSKVLLDSIHRHILALPPATRLLPGHGPETTVEEEMLENPFL